MRSVSILVLFCHTRDINPFPTYAFSKHHEYRRPVTMKWCPLLPVPCKYECPPSEINYKIHHFTLFLFPFLLSMISLYTLWIGMGGRSYTESSDQSITKRHGPHWVLSHLVSIHCALTPNTSHAKNRWKGNKREWQGKWTTYSILKSLPVIKLLASLNKNTAAPLYSSGLLTLPNIFCLGQSVLLSGNLLNNSSTISVTI